MRNSLSLVLHLIGRCKWIFTNVYGSNWSLMREFWEDLDSIRGKWSCLCCASGEHHLVFHPKEGGYSMMSAIWDFSKWINREAFIDFPIAGAQFTCVNHQCSPSMLRLIRIFVDDDWCDLCCWD